MRKLSEAGVVAGAFSPSIWTTGQSTVGLAHRVASRPNNATARPCLKTSKDRGTEAEQHMAMTLVFWRQQQEDAGLAGQVDE